MVNPINDTNFQKELKAIFARPPLTNRTMLFIEQASSNGQPVGPIKVY